MMRRSGIVLDRTWVALLLLALALGPLAGVIGLLEPTETRYAEIAREMRSSGDYLAPRLNGLLHFDKPPLAYWSVAAGFAACGENEWGARLPVLLAALVTLALTALAARRFAALLIRPGLATWLLGSCLLFATVGRALASDPFLGAAVTGFWAFAPSPVAIAWLGVGFLAKGPVVFVPTLLVILAVAALSRDRVPLRWLGPAWSWWLFAGIALPWYLLIVSRTPGLLRFFLADELWARYTTSEHHRPGPPWYFVGVLIAGALPWTPALVAGLARSWRERSRIESRLLLGWLLVPLAFFSFSGSKLPAYLLPVFPAVALLAARGLEPDSRAARWSTAAALASAAVAGWSLGPALLGWLVGMSPPRALPLPLAAHAGLACFACAAAWVAGSRPARAALFVTLGFAALLVAAAPYEGALGSPRGIAAVLRENRAAGERVVEVARFNAGLPFYLRERVRLLEVPRDRGFGDAARGAEVDVTSDSLAAWAADHGRVWLLGPEARTEALAASLGVHYRAVARWRGNGLGFLDR
jgi:hypothetical protein